MKEIGGYFGLEQLISNEYYADLIALNTARNALAYLIEARKIEKLYIPFYLCDSVSDVCDREQCRYEYYHIDKKFRPVFEKKLNDSEYLYIVNYFGQISNEELAQLKTKYNNIIFDNVQAFFQGPTDNVDTIYSCRKFFGVPDGAYLSTDAVLERSLETDISMDRIKHIMGRFEGGCASDYYNDFKHNDETFDKLALKAMSKLTHNILGAIDYDYVIKKRNENFAFLAEKLRSINKLEISVPNGPYMYPFYCENGMAVKKKLAEKKIFVPTLWPNVLDTDSSLDRDYAENIMPLPCDQRYGSEDMNRVVKEIHLCLN